MSTESPERRTETAPVAVTKRRAAEMLETTPRTIERLVQRGTLRRYRVRGSRLVRFRQSDVEALLEDDASHAE